MPVALRAPLRGARKMSAARALLAGTRLGRQRRGALGVAGYHRSARVNAVLEDLVTSGDERVAPAPPAEEPTRPAVTPGDADRQRFTLHWSVDMWRDFNPRAWLAAVEDEASPLPARLSSFADTMTKALSSTGALGSPEAARYWAYHVARSGFFATQAVLGLAAARASAGRSQNPDSAVSRTEALARNGWQGPVAEAMLMYYQDYENIKEGRYILPWDMTTPTHRQFNPLFVARRAAAFVAEAADTLRRRERGAPDDIWLRSSLLPDYFQGGFHYQTDGWLSQASAKVYETSTETLFVGRQDAMQRCTLVPVADFMAGKDASQVRALEVACGTGRFATFFKDNWPSADLTLADLSPFYLAEARQNLRYWKSQRAAGAALPGVDRNGAAFLQAAAEALPAPDASYDLVYSVYLFHELPPAARRAAAGEMARVVKPGGMVVLTDSMQLGDRPIFDATMANFGDFNEPFYRGYVAEDLGALFVEAGLECDTKVVGSTTKTLSFRKPLAAAGAAAEVAEALEGLPAPPQAGDHNQN